MARRRFGAGRERQFGGPAASRVPHRLWQSWWCMIFSENRFPLFRIMHGLAVHDLFGKPVPTFPDHARAPARFSEFFKLSR
jgi:hypothetical protein